MAHQTSFSEFAALAAPGGLSAEELRRYARQLVLPEVGLAGQERLKAARVLVVGAGGLGSPAALYLVAAGVGTLGLVEFDRVEPPDLHRQVLYATSDLGRAKLEAAAARLVALNPHVAIESHAVRLDVDEARRLVGQYDLVVDGSDNFSTRYAVNDACVLAGRPCVHGAVQRFVGQVGVFWAGRGPCYRCLFPEAPPAGLIPACAEGGVLGAVAGVVGSLQAGEALKLLLGAGEPLLGRLLVFDVLAGRVRELRVRRSATCPACGVAAVAVALAPEAEACGSAQRSGPAIDVEPADVARWLAAGRRLRLLDVRTPAEHALVHLPGSLLIPLDELPARLGELDPDQPLVVYCHYGPRSRAAVELLRARGLGETWNLAGGIDAWSSRVDPAVRRY